MAFSLVRLMRSRVLVFAIIGVVLFGIFGGGLSALSLANVPAEESYEFGSGTYKGHIKFTGGRDNAGGAYVSSWYYDGQSEAITTSAWFTGETVRASVQNENIYRPDKFMLKLWLNGVVIKSTEVPFSQGSAPGHNGRADVDFGTDPRIKGTSSGVLKVELLAHLCTKVQAFRGCTERGWVLVAQDGARLVDGFGSIRLDEKRDVYQAGTQVRVRVTSGEGEWRLRVFDPVGQPKCIQSGFGGQFSLSIDRIFEKQTSSCDAVWTGARSGALFTFTVPADAFRADGKNLWRIQLENTIIEQSAATFVAIDDVRKSPETPVVKPDNTNPSVGQTVQFPISARANPATGAAIEAFDVCAWYGSENMPPPESDANNLGCKRVPATSNGHVYTGLYTITIDRPAKLQYRVYSIDAAGRMSGSQIDAPIIKALEAEGMEKPNTNSQGEIETEEAKPAGARNAEAVAKISAAMSILLLLFATIVSALVWAYLPQPPTVKIIAIVLTTAITAFVVVGGL